MTAPLDVRYVVRGYSGRETSAVVHLRELTAAQRIRRGGLALAACWGAAVVAVFIPIAHFVLVPGLFLAGLGAFGRGMRVRVVAAGGTTECPDCGAAQPLDVSGAWRGLGELQCRHCQRTLRALPA